ncbi:hypothetical protein BJV74DRAFT_533803 [Russula compacta]|nr:hypothetical protein BJV74DRAFT_533803 [Russula compacta]
MSAPRSLVHKTPPPPLFSVLIIVLSIVSPSSATRVKLGTTRPKGRGKWFDGPQGQATSCGLLIRRLLLRPPCPCPCGLGISGLLAIAYEL